MKNAGCTHTNPLTSTWPAYTHYVTLPSENPCPQRHFSAEETEAQRGLFPASRCAGAALHAHQAGLEPNPGLRGMSALTAQGSSLDPGPWTLVLVENHRPLSPHHSRHLPILATGGQQRPSHLRAAQWGCSPILAGPGPVASGKGPPGIVARPSTEREVYSSVHSTEFFKHSELVVSV